MNDLLLESKEIVERAISELQPYAVILMLSGGDDSVTVGAVAKALGVKIDFVIHGRTRTGVVETTEFAREVAPDFGGVYLEADAGDTYERTVLARGFFGQGRTAHSHCYHRLKSQPFNKAISHNIRKYKHGRKMLLLNGARTSESDRRKKLIEQGVVRKDSYQHNYWVSLIHHWDKRSCLDFLQESETKRNPVCNLIHRSGECLCGSMQYQEDRQEVAFWYPEWGKWLDDLEKRVKANGFPWGWGEPATKKMFKKYALPSEEIVCGACLAREEEGVTQDGS